MKKAIIVIMVFCLLTTSFADTVFAQAAGTTTPPLSMQILGKKADTANPPIVKDNRVYLPLRAVGEALSYKVTWNAKTSTMELKAANSTLKVTIGSKTAYVNGKKVTLDAAPIMYKDRAHVPLTFVQKYFNNTTTYDKVKNVVSIEKKAAANTGTAAAQTKGLYILGKKVNTTDLPLVKDNVVYIPLRHFGEGLGYKVIWTASAKTMDLKSDKGSSRVVIGSGTVSVNGKSVKMSPAALLYNGRAYVPVSFIENNFEYEVSYNKEKNITNIDKKTTAANTGTTAQTKGIYVLGKKVSATDLPLIKDNTTYIPLRHFGEGLGYKVTWTASNNTMDLKSDGGSAKVVIGSGTASVNGKSVKINPAALLYNGRAYVPVSFIEGNFDYDVTYDKTKNIATIDKKKPAEVLPEKPPEDTVVYSKAKIEDIVYDDNGGFPQLNIVADNPVKYKSTTMYNPDRMIVDIENATLNTEFETKEIGQGGVIRVRVAQFSTSPDIVRVAIDLEDETACKLVQSNDKKTVSLIYANIINPVSFMKESSRDVLMIRGTQENDTNVFQLENPDRLVVDVQKAVLSELQTVETKTSFVKAIRTGQADVGVARVVLDLEPGMYYDVKSEGSLTKVYVSNIPFSFVDYKKYYNSASIKLNVGTEVEYQPIIDTATRTLRVLIPKDLDVEQKVYPINDDLMQQIVVTKETHGDKVYTVAAFKMKSMVEFELLSPAVTKLVNIKFKHKADSIDQITVLIDPGHGGKDPGAISIDKSTNEKTLNLDVALRLNRILKGLGFNTMMTRTDDSYVDLASRSGMANNNYVDFFMSIHFNAFASSAKGIETLYFPNEITEEYPIDNRKMASIFHSEITDALKRPSRGITPRPGLHVLNKTKMPAILAELGFITNPEELAQIKKEDYREMAARALAVSIVKFYKEMEDINLDVDIDAIYAAPMPKDPYKVEGAELDTAADSLVSEQIPNDSAVSGN